ncbi:MAG TPA: murein biosynthesis integral membrane protein MurJ [Candidatus Saccharimonadales bacterium]|nr:murein biosynthesis integral membrane protein MurJ [Candidatus Saccharimonadales bacterium]
MVKNFLSRVNSRTSIGLAASFLAGSTLIASLLGLYREKLLLSYYFDTYPQAIDAYKVAFTIPDFMFFILVSGALSVTFIPVFNARLAHGNKKSAWELSSSLLNLLAIITFFASILIIIFAEPLVQYVLAPGFDESTRGLAVSMMRVIAINPFLFSIASVLSSMQQAVGRFFFYALAPAVYNIGIIFGIVFLTNGINIFGLQVFEGGIMGVALGVVIGSILQLAVSSIGMVGMNFEYSFKIFWRNLGLQRVLRLLPPRSIDQGIDYINNLVEINLASRLGPGKITAYQVATTLHMLPINLIGVAIATAAFPKMTQRIASGEEGLFKNELQSVLRVIIWLALPVAAITFLARGYIVAFVKVGGDPEIAGVLGVLALAILFRSVYHLASRSFYAQQDTKTPLYISLVTIALNIILSITFVLHLGLNIYGLAAAQSITAFVEVVILFIIMSQRIPKLFDKRLINAVLRMVCATGIMFIATYTMVKAFNLSEIEQSFFALLPPFALIVSVSFAIYLLLCRILRIEEVKPVLEYAKKILFYNQFWSRKK